MRRQLAITKDFQALKCRIQRTQSANKIIIKRKLVLTFLPFVISTINVHFENAVRCIRMGRISFVVCDLRQRCVCAAYWFLNRSKFNLFYVIRLNSMCLLPNWAAALNGRRFFSPIHSKQKPVASIEYSILVCVFNHESGKKSISTC